ncbi:hypothetical protein BMJ20_33560 [Sinorhizobium medicae]|nr:hypothetical protein BMJ31_17495 [Sinorhizobium medicae]PLU30762.1 hypothetical protein BMJ28_23735 [Sinorhizobium medicae]PLU58042.1 hypothetical protein BMJ24_17135 [Sinorhizobium medicae]PLU65106.1 hypothetical protein BMJ20_33560 [Sinorhizobium medicae]
MLLAYAGPAAAQFITGNKLLDMCQERNRFALGYTVAVTDWVMTELKSEVCIPSTVTSGQMHDIICGYLTKYPDRRHAPAHFSGAQALIEAFPCSK